MASRAIALTSLVALNFFFLRAMTQPLCNAAMPYEISFRKFIEVPDPEIYFNECCWGGDVVQQQLLPLVTAEYTDVMAEQEDWGWFIWFKKGDLVYIVVFVLLTVFFAWRSEEVHRADDKMLNHQFHSLLLGIVLILGVSASFLVPYLFHNKTFEEHVV